MRAEDAPPAVIRGMKPDSAISRGSVPLGTGAGEGHGRVWCGDVGAWSWGLGVLGFGKQECEREREGAWGVPPPLFLSSLTLSFNSHRHIRPMLGVRTRARRPPAAAGPPRSPVREGRGSPVAGAAPSGLARFRREDRHQRAPGPGRPGQSPGPPPPHDGPPGSRTSRPPSPGWQPARTAAPPPCRAPGGRPRPWA